MKAAAIKKEFKSFVKWGSYELWNKPFSRYIPATENTEELYFEFDYIGDMPKDQVVNCINQIKAAIVDDLESKPDDIILGHSKRRLRVGPLKVLYYLGAGGTGGGGNCPPQGCQ